MRYRLLDLYPGKMDNTSLQASTDTVRPPDRFQSSEQPIFEPRDGEDFSLRTRPGQLHAARRVGSRDAQGIHRN